MKYDDLTRFEKIIKFLPEQRVGFFIDELWNGYYSKGLLPMLVNYKDYSETILSEFKNKRLEKERKKFNKSIRSLLLFLDTHFFSHFENYALYPELRGTPLWDRRFEELHTQIEEFKQGYEKLIVVGKQFLDKTSVVPQKGNDVEGTEEHRIKPLRPKKLKGKLPKTFEIQVKDRYIWVNNYLLSKPHATGVNLEFFEYIQGQKPNTKIERNKLPDFGKLALKQEVKNSSFIKILNKLGFKGEISKAFFYKRGKDSLFYRGDKITQKDLEKAGVKMPILLKELELAHIRNNPE